MKRPATRRKPVVIVRQKIIRRTLRDHGAWKVAFADFTTAMMAFFLLLWLLENASVPEKMAISGYFVPPGGAFSNGGADAGLNESPNPVAPAQWLATAEVARPPARDGGAPESQPTDELLREQYRRQEIETLDKLKQKLLLAIETDTVFSALKGQISIDINLLGLRVEIADKAQRPMFDLGRAQLKPYTEDVLRALAPLLDGVPNRISITGHTDAFAYGDGAAYSNWELSADRANAARRALLAGGYPEDKIAAVQGMGDTALFKPQAPLDAANRRIAIIVLRRFAEKSFIDNGPAQPAAGAVSDAWR